MSEFFNSAKFISVNYSILHRRARVSLASEKLQVKNIAVESAPLFFSRDVSFCAATFHAAGSFNKWDIFVCIIFPFSIHRGLRQSRETLNFKYTRIYVTKKGESGALAIYHGAAHKKTLSQGKRYALSLFSLVCRRRRSLLSARRSFSLLYQSHFGSSKLKLVKN
jgi:hypothetical protein